MGYRMTFSTSPVPGDLSAFQLSDSQTLADLLKGVKRGADKRRPQGLSVLTSAGLGRGTPS